MPTTLRSDSGVKAAETGESVALGGNQEARRDRTVSGAYTSWVSIPRPQGPACNYIQEGHNEDFLRFC
jgi:hypothetical protein